MSPLYRLLVRLRPLYPSMARSPSFRLSFALSISFFVSSIAQACSPRPPSEVLRCLASAMVAPFFSFLPDCQRFFFFLFPEVLVNDCSVTLLTSFPLFFVGNLFFPLGFLSFLSHSFFLVPAPPLPAGFFFFFSPFHSPGCDHPCPQPPNFSSSGDSFLPCIGPPRPTLESLFPLLV